MRFRVIAGLLLSGVGMREMVVYSHTPFKWIIGPLMMALGIGLSIWGTKDKVQVAYRFINKRFGSGKGNEVEGKKRAEKRQRSIYFPILGIIILLVTLLLTLSTPKGESAFNNYDLVLLAFGSFITAYPILERKFSWESRFLLIFFAIFVLGVVIAHKTSVIVFPSGAFRSTMNIRFTVGPLTKWLGILGLDIARHKQVLFFTAPSGPTSLYIGPPCSGYFSIATFLAVMISYMVASRYSIRKGLPLAALGIIIGYSANMIRLTILVLIAMRYGMEAMAFVHTYLGTVLFVIWNLLFWVPVIYFNKKKKGNKTKGRQITF